MSVGTFYAMENVIRSSPVLSPELLPEMTNIVDERVGSKGVPSMALWQLHQLCLPQQQDGILNSANLQSFSSTGSLDTSVFPQKLHNVLDTIEADGLSSIISWLPHGRAFRVHKPKEFAERVVLPYFGILKSQSVRRQLNVWGFKRVTSGRDRGSYYHKNFLRGKPSLCKLIKRSALKGTGLGRKPENSEDIPNFYDMPPLDEEAKQVSLQHHNLVQPCNKALDNNIIEGQCLKGAVTGIINEIQFATLRANSSHAGDRGSSEYGAANAALNPSRVDSELKSLPSAADLLQWLDETDLLR